MKIHHIALWTNDLERLKEFYVSNFGCTSSEKYINAKKGFSSYFLSFSDGPKIEIMSRDDVNQTINNVYIGLAHFAVNVGSSKNVDLLTNSMKKAGVKVISAARTTGDGYYESVILDPDKNKIELVATNNL